ncbi:DUF7507 domain-containing protein, partial [Aquimarina addita]|uniref:DUF7507 domain-containing protein n=1 Tax=Aquimarina addita TaxID=870485 RepID=UPI0031EFF25B
EIATFRATYTITQADINAGGIENSATGTGTPPADPDGTVNPPLTDVSDAGDDTTETPDINGNTDGDPTNDPTVTTIPTVPELTLTKTAVLNDGGDGVIDENDTITYTFNVENTGNVTIDNITFTDIRTSTVDGTITPDILNPGQTGTATVVYLITQLDLDSGSITNSATVTGDSPSGNDDVTDVSDNGDETNDGPDADMDPTNDPTVTILPSNPSLQVTKRDDVPADGSYDTVGELITYTIEVTNNGNVTLSNVVVMDGNADTISPSTIASIDPNETVTVTATHIITQLDIDLGIVTNVANVVAEAPDTTVINEDSDDPDTAVPDDDTITPINQTSSIELTKAADAPVDGNYDTLGEAITYTIIVTNTGNTTLNNIEVTDNNADAGSITPAAVGTLAPGLSTTVTASHTITQADLDLGTVTNVAQVTSEDPQGDSVTDLLSDDPSTLTPDDPTIVMVNMNPSLLVTKAADTPAFSEIGDVITYTIEITNDGNVNLTNLILTDDNATIISGTPIPDLMPGESTTVIAEHIVTISDIVSGQVVNVAIVDADAPGSVSITETSDDPNNPTDNDADLDGDPDDPTVSLLDTDGDGIPNVDDLDDDNDGITDVEEQNGDPTLDTDGDGIIDSQDLDADGDGVNDVAESGHGMLDLDNDGMLDGPFGLDGIPDIVQEDPDGGTVNYSLLDTDGDGIDDFQDVDDDGDSILTSDENPNPDGDGNPDTGDTQDTDGDGIPDYLDMDDDGDSVDTVYEDYDGNDNPIDQDSDSDGIPDYLDTDDDGDGVDTIFEGPDPDGDGNPNTGDTQNTDCAIDNNCDSIPDYLDIDDDGDTIETADENPDQNGDGNPDDALDTNGDGTPDYLEPNSPIDPDLEDGIQIYSGFSPNGDGMNDVFTISGIENFENTLEIYNRWGVKVFSTSNYGRDDNFFRGISNGRLTIEETDELPTGTYYYVLEYTLDSGELKNRAGYLYINR